MSFQDHFSRAAGAYAAFRPTYPAALFDALAGLVPAHRTAWDCATGSGQAACALAARFERVVATDASAEQIAAARAHPGVEYRLAEAGDSGLEAGSIDLVTVAQALHWFDLGRFYAEARRVLVPGGVLAVWTYADPRLDEPALDAAIRRFTRGTVGAFWPPERRLVDDGYRSLAFPFEEIALPGFVLERAWTLPELAGYLRTWSASQRYLDRHGADPVLLFEAEARAAWGDPALRRTARWPLAVRAGRAT